MVTDESQPETQPDGVYSYQPLEKEQNVFSESKQKERPSPLPTMTGQAEDAHREVRRLSRERRPRTWLTYETLIQLSIYTNVDAFTSQMSPIPALFRAYLPGQVIVPYTPQMYMPHDYYMQVTKQVY